jgi:hypothetical protein
MIEPRSERHASGSGCRSPASTGESRTRILRAMSRPAASTSRTAPRHNVGTSLSVYSRGAADPCAGCSSAVASSMIDTVAARPVLALAAVLCVARTGGPRALDDGAGDTPSEPPRRCLSPRAPRTASVSHRRAGLRPGLCYFRLLDLRAQRPSARWWCRQAGPARVDADRGCRTGPKHAAAGRLPGHLLTSCRPSFPQAPLPPAVAADVCGDATDDHSVDSPVVELFGEIGSVEGAVAGLADDQIFRGDVKRSLHSAVGDPSV